MFVHIKIKEESRDSELSPVLSISTLSLKGCSLASQRPQCLNHERTKELRSLRVSLWNFDFLVHNCHVIHRNTRLKNEYRVEGGKHRV